ncbi:MAG: hypothetical protein ABIJ43_05525 [Candidatus Beckwithbacteria bacterium]
MRKWIIKNEKKVMRFLEIMPGFISWSLIIFPIWGAFWLQRLWLTILLLLISIGYIDQF